MSAMLDALPDNVIPMLAAAPRREPPFDDELDPSAPSPSRADRPLPFVRPRAAGRQAKADRRPGLSDPVRSARCLLIGVIEAASGRRPLRQLVNLLSLHVMCDLRDTFDVLSRHDQRHWLHRATVRSVHLCEPRDGIAELAATVSVGNRVRAIALRMEYRHDQWQCTRLQFG